MYENGFLDPAYITPEEQQILDGNIAVQKNLYTSKQDFVVESDKFLEHSEDDITLRRHTRFVDEVLDAGIIGDGKVQILTDTTVTFQRIDDKIRQNIILVDQSQDILEIGGADDDVNAQIFLAAGYYRMFDMLVHK